MRFTLTLRDWYTLKKINLHICRWYDSKFLNAFPGISEGWWLSTATATPRGARGYPWPLVLLHGDLQHISWTQQIQGLQTLSKRVMCSQGRRNARPRAGGVINESSFETHLWHLLCILLTSRRAGLPPEWNHQETKPHMLCCASDCNSYVGF